MKQFFRIFEYIKPQWPRVVLIVFTAVLIGILFTLSFMTISPLLKVMMGEEGLHGWIDREICSWRYGIEFYVPDTIDITTTDLEYYLLVTEVKEEGLAFESGFQKQDKIVGIAELAIDEQTKAIPAPDLMQALAGIEDKSVVPVQVRRNNPQGISELVTIEMNVEKKSKLISQLEKIMNLVPRNQGKKTRKLAVIFIIVLMGVVTTARCLARFAQNYLCEKVVQISVANLRKKVFTHVMYMPIGFFSSQGTADTTSRIMSDIAGIGTGVKVLLGKTLREPLKAIGTLSGAFIFSWKLTLIFLLMAPVTIFSLAMLGKKIKKATKRSMQTVAKMLGRVQDAMEALRVIKVYNQQDHECTEYSRVNLNLLKHLLKVAKIESMTGPLMDFLGMLAGSAALIVGVHWIFSASQDIKPSSFFALLVLLGITAESIRKVSDVWNKLQRAEAAAERVYEIVDQPREIEVSDARELERVEQSIEFCDVSFTYPKSKTPVLQNVNLTVQAGQTVAVVGPNGSGKTTLVNLIPRFYEVNGGNILIDGQDIAHATLKSIRQQISMVTQNVVTFNDTLAANIAYGKPDATREEIIQAAKQSYAHEFIEPLPDGYDTVIGEHGSGFSGGQLQRIVIARAILKNPAILIFDEAMSQIDADSEAKIHKALSEIMHDRTCFLIAHRFSTVISADSIVVMNQGQIVAQGKHEELIESCTIYKSLYETQLM